MTAALPRIGAIIVVSAAIFLAGLWRAWMTGQVDPWDWTMGAAIIAGVVGLLAGWSRRAIGLWAGLGGAGMALLFCIRASARAPDPAAAASLLAVVLLASSGGVMLRSFPGASARAWKQAALAAATLVATVILLWLGPPQPIRPTQQRPPLAVITGLPLFWDEMGRGGPRDAPIMSVLRSRFTITPLDDPRQLRGSKAQRLLLAQPRALSPEQLTAIDQWVRGGGRALVLADPLLRWPSALPLGDRRRPPAIHLLDPLLAHWGWRPSAAPAAGEKRQLLTNGAVATLHDGVLAADGPALLRVGKGTARIVEDADFLDDRLWLADPQRPLDSRLWSADTPALVAGWLGADLPGRRRWMRTADDVTAALRWSFLAGTIWAILGAVVLAGRMHPLRAGTKRENKSLKTEENG